ncbi:protein phosphatase 2C domain-containing protein [Kitasatospora sp. NPDC051914]|uniref:protein phosphatase 2C domain-containing protein n=1 Tax=Kitasatospora sp. NPDC051914 TaxID=3154945 RepID=UPI003432D817
MNEEHAGRDGSAHRNPHAAAAAAEWRWPPLQAPQRTEQADGRPAVPPWEPPPPQHTGYRPQQRPDIAVPPWEPPPAAAPVPPDDRSYAHRQAERPQQAEVEETVAMAVLRPTADHAGHDPGLGPAAHTGVRPPAYPAEPGELTETGSDLFAAMVPDTVVDGGTVGSATVRAASIRGDSHRYAKECRQDSVLLARVGGIAVLAAADGVGSARYSHRGSAGACRLLVSCLLNDAERLSAALHAGDGNGFARHAHVVMGRVAERLRAEAEKAGHGPAEYATTLRALLVPTDPQSRVRGFLAVGDGGLFRLRGGRWESLERIAGEGAVFDTGTEALPVNFGAPVVDLVTDGLPGDVLVMCTDGLANPLTKEPGVAEFYAQRWGGGTVPGLAEYLWQAQIRARSYDDDRSVVCLWEGER